MGRRGPAPEPTKLRVLKGETKPSRLNTREPQPPTEPLVPPETLGSEARAVWDRLAPALYERGLLSVWDAEPFAVYCGAIVQHHRAEVLLGPGLLIRGQRDSSLVKNPAWSIYRDTATLIRVYAREFGLTPSARSGLKVDESDDADLAGILS